MIVLHHPDSFIRRNNPIGSYKNIISSYQVALSISPSAKFLYKNKFPAYEVAFCESPAAEFLYQNKFPAYES